jgi:hypothetical protein
MPFERAFPNVKHARKFGNALSECVYKLLMSLYLRLFSPEGSSLCLGNIKRNIAQAKRGALRGK